MKEARDPGPMKSDFKPGPLCARVLPSFRDREAANTPIVGLDLFNHDNCGRRVLVQRIDQQVRDAPDECGFLFGRGAVLGDLDIYEWQNGISFPQ